MPHTATLPARELTTEYVAAAGGSLSWYDKARIVLPFAFDDITREKSFEAYDKMLLDSQVAACITFFKAAILEEGIVLSSPIADPDADGYKKAARIADECSAMLEEMETSIDDVLWSMMDAIVYGAKVGEEVWYLHNDRLDVRAIKVKPVNSVVFVVDEFYNLLGFLDNSHGQGFLATKEKLLNPEKFMIYSFRPKDSDPRGTSLLRPAYDPWWRKRQVIPEYLKYLAQFASASVIGMTAEGARLEENSLERMPDGTQVTTPEQAMAVALTRWRNGSVAAFPSGSKVEIVKSEGEGKAFLAAISQSNLEITKAVLTQELATEQSEYMARAAAEVHQDVLDTLIRQGKRGIVRSFNRHIIRPWVIYNYGEKTLKLAPRASVGMIEHQDLAPLMNAIASLRRASYFTEEQMPELDKLLSLPVRTSNKLAGQAQQQPKPQQPQQPQDQTQPEEPPEDGEDTQQ